VADSSISPAPTRRAGHIATNNGLFPAVRGYDLATGIGTIKMAPFIVGSF
jgi:hypothetical protein